jgi:phosphoribosylanthranilate isomerase
MSGLPRVKICGLTRTEDAELAIALGADALGFVFWPRSPRSVAPSDVRQIIARLPPLVTRVGVFVNASPEDVGRVVRETGIDVAQLHGDERPEAFAAVGARLMKVVTLETDASIETAVAWPPTVMPLVDARDDERKGGTGRVADWERAALLAARRPIVLAGGLTESTIRAAVRRVRPWAVDVSSGVEERPGLKSPARMRAFFAALALVDVEEE